MGGALVGNLLASALERGIHVVRDARVTGLSRSADGGWSLTMRDGAFSLAANNVVIASGGFEWNAELVSALLPFTITPISAPSNEGDGLALGLGVAARSTSSRISGAFRSSPRRRTPTTASSLAAWATSR